MGLRPAWRLAGWGQFHRVADVDERRVGAPSEAFQVAAETRAFLTQKGVDLTGEQETKTKKALEYFSEQVRAGGD